MTHHDRTFCEGMTFGEAIEATLAGLYAWRVSVSLENIEFVRTFALEYDEYNSSYPFLKEIPEDDDNESRDDGVLFYYDDISSNAWMIGARYEWQQWMRNRTSKK